MVKHSDFAYSPLFDNVGGTYNIIYCKFHYKIKHKHLLFDNVGGTYNK